MFSYEEYMSFRTRHYLSINENSLDVRDYGADESGWRSRSPLRKQYLPEENFIDPFDPTEQELTMFELLYGTDSKDEYLKWMNAVIEFRKQEKEDEIDDNN